MRRRDFISIAGSAAAWPLAAHAQQPAMPVIGLLNGRARGSLPKVLAAFHQGLNDTGYMEAQNVARMQQIGARALVRECKGSDRHAGSVGFAW
jgi:hypothetical protein